MRYSVRVSIALNLVYASSTIPAMHSTEVWQAPGRFRCGITMEGALKVLRTQTKIIGPEPLRDNQFYGAESLTVRAGRTNLWLTTSLQFGAKNQKVSSIVYFYGF